MKVIFLDIDGVLSPIQNSSPKPDKTHGHFPFAVEFSKTAVKNLKNLLEQSGAKIVLSTRWIGTVGFKATVLTLASHGINGPYVVEQDVSTNQKDHVTPHDWVNNDSKFWGTTITPKKMSSDKCHEISFWLRDNLDKISGYVVLDDDFIYGQDNYQVQTKASKGLTKADVTKALTILNAGLDHYKKK